MMRLLERYGIRSARRIPTLAVLFGLIAAGGPIVGGFVVGGCGLGYIEIKPEQFVTLRVENAAPDTVAVTVSDNAPSTITADSPDASFGLLDASLTVLRVRSGSVANGRVRCGPLLTISVAVGEASQTVIDLTGAGTGTLGFDSGTVGLSGERFLQEGIHFSCEDTVLIKLPRSTSGELVVVARGEPLPEPITDVITIETDPGSDPEILIDEEPIDEEPDSVTLVVVNPTDSTVQINFAAGDGTLADGDGTGLVTEFDVRVPPQSTTRGTGDCAQEYVVAASHLQSTDSTIGAAPEGLFTSGGGITFHGVALSGDGTGTAGFDSNTLAVVRGRLLQIGTHYECGDEIVITVVRTNNQLQLDEDDNVVIDEFGNPTIKYNVGVGTVQVNAAP